jgi:hypothetical protein
MVLFRLQDTSQVMLEVTTAAHGVIHGLFVLPVAMKQT